VTAKKKIPPGGPDAFLDRVLRFVDQNGKVVAKDSSPVHSALTMRYDSDVLKIKMHATMYAMGNGSCGAQIKYLGKTVFSAAGSYTVRPFEVEVVTYEPGPWERLIRPRERL
jgi:hypothetical protein